MIEQVNTKSIQDFIGLQCRGVRDNVNIVTSDQLGRNYMLRIDKKLPDVFYPNMPKSADPRENDSCPRITCAPTLLGCMIGYFRMESDITTGSLPDESGYHAFFGGYYISKLPFDACLKPNKNLVVDADRSGEHWIVPNSWRETDIKPNRIGEFFVSALTMLPVSSSRPGVRLVVCLKVDGDDEIYLDNEKKLSKGFYRFVIFWPDVKTRSIDDKNALFSPETIDETTYYGEKKQRANLLSFQEIKPIYENW